jgi:hypothetical protein
MSKGFIQFEIPEKPSECGKGEKDSSENPDYFMNVVVEAKGFCLPLNAEALIKFAPSIPQNNARDIDDKK